MSLDWSIYMFSTTELVIALWILGGLLIWGALIWLIVHLFRYNIKVVAFEKVGSRGQRSKTYSGRHIVKNGNEFLKIAWRSGDLMPWPSTKYITNNRGWRFKTLLHFYKTSEAAEDWKPVSVQMDDHKKVKMEAHDAEVRLWSTTRQREKVTKYDNRGFLEKYGAYVGLGLVAIILVVTVIFTMDALKETTAHISDTQKQVSGDLVRIEQIQDRLIRQQATVTEPSGVPPGG